MELDLQSLIGLLCSCTRREIITVRGQSYVYRLPKYWPPTPLSARRVCRPPQQRRGVHTRRAERGGWSIFWKTRGIGLPSYSNNLSTAVLIGWDPATTPLPPRLGSYTRALLVSQDWRHLYVTPWLPARPEPVFVNLLRSPGIDS
jgi:hypothetical protein